MKTKATRRLAWHVLDALFQGEKDFSDGRRPFEVELLIDALTRNGVDRDTIRAAMEDESDRRHADKARRNPERRRAIRDKALRAAGAWPPVKRAPAQWVIECLPCFGDNPTWYRRTDYGRGASPRYILGQLRALRENEEFHHDDPADRDQFRVRLAPGSPLPLP